MVQIFSITMQNMVGLGFTPPAREAEIWCLCFCPSGFLNGQVCANDFIINAFEYRNDFDIVG